MDIYIYMALIGITAGLVKGLSGFGSSLVTLPLLTMVLGENRITDIVVIMITFNLILNLLLMKENNAFSKKNFDKIYLITPIGAITTIIGLEYLQVMNEGIIIIIASILIFLAILVTSYNLFVVNKIHLKPNRFIEVIVGLFSGFGNGIASIDGPPVVFYLTATNEKKESFKGILATHFLVMGIIAVIYALIDSMFTKEIVLYTLYISLFTIGGLFAGMNISKKLDERMFRIVVLIILLALDIKMIFF